MLNKIQLLTVNHLKLSDKIEKMDDDQYDKYCKTLDAFTENLPVQESKLKQFFEAKDYDSFSNTLLSMKDALINIYADDLAQDCLKLISDVRTSKYEVVQAYLTYFLTAISTLSIDIQMAQHKNETMTVNMRTRPTESVKEDEAECRKKIILAVDDVSLLLNGLKAVLQELPYKFVGVTSGAAALKYIKEHTPDLFILDIEMPTMNGYELAKKIRESGHTAPIVFLTGNAKKEYVLKAIQVGAADFIVKPIDKEPVLEKIRKYIGQ